MKMNVWTSAMVTEMLKIMIMKMNNWTSAMVMLKMMKMATNPKVSHKETVVAEVLGQAEDTDTNTNEMDYDPLAMMHFDFDFE